MIIMMPTHGAARFRALPRAMNRTPLQGFNTVIPAHFVIPAKAGIHKTGFLPFARKRVIIRMRPVIKCGHSCSGKNNKKENDNEPN